MKKENLTKKEIAEKFNVHESEIITIDPESEYQNIKEVVEELSNIRL